MTGVQTCALPISRVFSQRRIRLLRRVRVDARADPALLRALLQSRHLLLRVLRDPRLANELVDRRHPSSSLQVKARAPCGGARRIHPRKTKPRLPLPGAEGRLALAEDRAGNAVMHLII